LWIPNELWAEQAISFTIGIFLAYGKQHKKELFQKCMTHPLYKSLLLLLIGTAFLAIKQMDAIHSLPEPFVYTVQLITKVGYALTILTATYGLKKYLDFHFFYFVGGLSYELYLLHGYTYFLLNTMSFIQIVFFFVITFVLAWILMWVSKTFLGFATHSLTCRK
jgi:peptidoglycan/LPS O-acetylase OafA/YrhL